MLKYRSMDLFILREYTTSPQVTVYGENTRVSILSSIEHEPIQSSSQDKSKHDRSWHAFIIRSVDYILFTTADVTLEANLNEVSDTCWVSKQELEEMFKTESKSSLCVHDKWYGQQANLFVTPPRQQLYTLVQTYRRIVLVQVVGRSHCSFDQWRQRSYHCWRESRCFCTSRTRHWQGQEWDSSVSWCIAIHEWSQYWLWLPHSAWSKIQLKSRLTLRHDRVILAYWKGLRDFRGCDNVCLVSRRSNNTTAVMILMCTGIAA